MQEEEERKYNLNEINFQNLNIVEKLTQEQFNDLEKLGYDHKKNTSKDIMTFYKDLVNIKDEYSPEHGLRDLKFILENTLHCIHKNIAARSDFGDNPNLNADGYLINMGWPIGKIETNANSVINALSKQYPIILSSIRNGEGNHSSVITELKEIKFNETLSGAHQDLLYLLSIDSISKVRYAQELEEFRTNLLNEKNKNESLKKMKYMIREDNSNYMGGNIFYTDENFSRIYTISKLKKVEETGSIKGLFSIK